MVMITVHSENLNSKLTIELHSGSSIGDDSSQKVVESARGVGVSKGMDIVTVYLFYDNITDGQKIFTLHCLNLTNVSPMKSIFKVTEKNHSQVR